MVKEYFGRLRGGSGRRWIGGSGRGIPDSGSDDNDNNDNNDNTGNSWLLTFLQAIVGLFSFSVFFSGMYFRYNLNFKSFRVFFVCLILLCASSYGLYKTKKEQTN